MLKIKTKTNIIFSFNVAGWGMPPDINILAEKMRWIGLQRYNIASLIEIMRFKERQCDLIINNENIPGDYSFVLCCNTIHTGKGMKIAPKAKIDDGLMDVIVVKKTNRLKLFSLFPKIFSGKHIEDSLVDYYQVDIWNNLFFEKFQFWSQWSQKASLYASSKANRLDGPHVCYTKMTA